MELFLMPLCYIWNRTKKQLTASTGDVMYPIKTKLKGQFHLSLLLEIITNNLMFLDTGFLTSKASANYFTCEWILSNFVPPVLEREATSEPNQIPKNF